MQTYEKGNISRYLSLVTIGQTVKIKGPKGKFVYKQVARFSRPTVHVPADRGSSR